MGQADAIPGLVDHAKVGRVLAFLVLAQARDMGDLARLDPGRAFGGIALVQQMGDRHVDEPGVANMAVLVDGRDLHRLCHGADVVGRVMAHRGQIEILQDVQHLQNHDAAARRGAGRNAQAAILGPQGFRLFRLAPSQILGADQAAVGGHIGGNRVGDGPGIELVGAALGDALVGLGHVRVLDDLARGLQTAVGVQINLTGRGRSMQIGGMRHPTMGFDLRPETMHMRADHIAVAGQGDGRGQNLGQAQRAEPRQRRIQGAQRFRRGDGLIADLVDGPFEDEAEAVLGLALQQIEPHIVGDGAGGAGVEIQAQVLAHGRQIHMHGAEPGNPAHERVDHRLREGGGDGGIDRVATSTKDFSTNLNRFRLGGHDHAVFHQAVPVGLEASRI